MNAVIFDFDGTIADSFDYVAGFLAKEAGLKKLTDEQKQELRGMSMFAMARQLGFSRWRMPWLFLKGRDRMKHAIHHLEPFPDIREVIIKLHDAGNDLYMVSSNSERNVSRFLERHSLDGYFIKIYGGVGIFGKAPALRSLLREHSLKLEEAIYIGDELRDVEAAQSIGLPVIAVNWGFARDSDLAAAEPTALVTTPKSLLRSLEKTMKE